MPKQLLGLRVDEVSLVDEPANPGAKVAFFKRKEDKPMNKFSAWIAKHLGKAAADELASIKKDAQSFDDIEMGNEAREASWNLQQSICSIIEDESLDMAAKTAKIDETITQFKAALSQEQLEQTGAGNSAGNGTSVVASTMKSTKGDKDMTPEELKKSIDGAVAEAMAKAKSETAEAIAKAKAEADEAIAKAKAEASAEVAKANDAVAKMIAERADEARLTKAKSMVEGVAGFTAEQVAGMLKSMDDKQAEELEKSLKALKSVAKTNRIFSEAGAPVGKSGSAYQQLEQKAAELIAHEPKLSKAQAMKRVTKSNPELYVQYRSEQN